MKICAIIAEFNPLHSGHKRLIDFAKNISDAVCIVMSGNFTQRGMPALCDKYSRARHAVFAGADIVVELPAVFAIQSAEDFSFGAIAVANALKCTSLAFGSESGDLERLQKCVDFLLLQNQNVQIKQNLKNGLSYPAAVGKACIEFSDLLSKPNNTLAIEYLKALSLTKSTIVPVTLLRNSDYNCSELTGDYASAAAIRNNLNSADVYRYIAPYVKNDIDMSTEEKFKQFVAGYLSMAATSNLEKTYSVTEGLHNRLFKYRLLGNYNDIVKCIKTKRCTQLKIQRVLLNYTLGIDKQTVLLAKSQPPQINVLAVNKNKLQLLANIAQCKTILNFHTENAASNVSDRADSLYCSLSGKFPLKALQKL